MYQSSTRTNFSDILVDPTTIALLGSIALHAIIGANLPFFNQLEKEGKKAEPSTVKVVELTAGELQRIPQAPPIATTPVLPPVTTPQIAPNSETVPFSPIRIPLETIIPTPTPGKKTPQAIPQKQPIAPIFAPNNSFKPSKPSIKTGAATKPSPIPTPLPVAKTTKVLTSPNPSQTSVPDDDGGDSSPTNSAVKPDRQAQSPSGTQPNPTPTNSSPQPTSSLPPTNNSAGSGSGYGAYAQDVAERIKKYVSKYPNIKLYPPKQLTQKYPLGISCSKLKQAPFIVLMAGFDKVPQGQDSNILGDTTSQPLDNNKSYTGDPQILANEKLLETSTTAGFVAATEAEKNRPVADRGVPVLYQYRVQFDPASCRN